MIKRTIILTILMVAVYSLLLIKLKPSLEGSLNQWQANKVKAEKYIYSNTGFENVIVGTSLSNRLIIDSLPGFYNLSFSDLSITDGLKIVLSKSVLPKRVFIETNMVFKKENDNFTSTLFNPLLYNIKKFNPSLRGGKQPVLIVYSSSVKLLATVENGLKERLRKGDAMENTQVNYKFKIAIQATMKYFAAKPGKEDKDLTFNNLNFYVKALKDKGVKVVFFEMPVNCRVTKSSLHKIVREFFLNKYTPGRFVYIPTPDCSNYETNDGIHFTDTDALRYAFYFKNEVSKLK